MRSFFPLLAAAGLLLTPAASFAEDDLPPWEKQKREDEKKAEEERKKKEAEEKAEADRRAAEHRAAVEAERARAEAEAAEEAAEASLASEDEPVWGGSTDDGAANKPARKAKAGPAGLIRSGGAVGLGFSGGTINGFSMKVWPAPNHGLVVGLGVPNRLNSGALHLSYRFHPKALPIPNSDVQVHLNLGPAIRARITGTTAVYVDIAGGLAVGASVTFRGAPIEIFATVVPEFTAGLTPPGVGLGFDVDGLAGLRLYL
jgi:hypothetical protein